MNIAPMEETGFLDSYQALISAELKPDFVAPVKYIAQWKQLSTSKNNPGSETKWITSSVRFFKIVGRPKGALYGPRRRIPT